jgi:hypothetical protein
MCWHRRCSIDVVAAASSYLWEHALCVVLHHDAPADSRRKLQQRILARPAGIASSIKTLLTQQYSTVLT